MTKTHTAPPPCPGPCAHTRAEHVAFDLGFLSASTGKPRTTPYRSAVLREAWEWGWDFGVSVGRKEEGTSHAL